MRIAEGLVELVCHARWLASHALSYIDPALQMAYQEPFENARDALTTTAKSMAHIERLSEVPPALFKLLCDGVITLLVGESVLRSCPPTMHSFLRQGLQSGTHNRQQVHLLAVRWFCASGVVSLDELTAVVFGSSQSPEESRNCSAAATNSMENWTDSAQASPPRFSSTIDLQNAIAEHLADTEPFYLGAHITLLRGILMRYCAALVGTEEVISHTDCLAPLSPDESRSADIAFDPRSIDDALLLWVRKVISLVEPVSPSGRRAKGALDASQLEDLYLHTNDGRVIATVIEHYRPDLVPATVIHMLHPLTVWQRQDNWSTIIRAAESLDLWVGIFPEEFVAHGFSTLQLHVLRFIEELFVVLAGEAEAEYKLMTGDIELDTSTRFVEISRSDSVARSLQLRRSNATMLTALSSNLVRLPADASERKFVALPVAVASDARDFPEQSSAEPRASTDTTFGPSPVQDFSSVVAAALRHSFAGPLRAAPALTDGEGATSIPSQQPEHDDEETTPGNEDGGGVAVSVVLTSMVLQGVAMPIHRASAVAEASRTLRPRSPELLEASMTSVGSVAPPENADVPPRSASPTITPSQSAASKRHSIPAGVPALSSTAHEPASGVRGNTLARSVQYFANERAALSESLRNSSVGLSRNKIAQQHSASPMNIVQGSCDAEGIDALLDELSNLEIPPATDAPVSQAEAARAENLRLRAALEQQHRLVKGAVERIRGVLKQRDFNLVFQHLKQHGGSADAPRRQPTTAGIAPCSFTPTLDALSMLAAAETGAGHLWTSPGDASGVPEKCAPTVSDKQDTINDRLASHVTTSVAAPSAHAGSVIEDPPIVAQDPPAPHEPKATAFDISVGGPSAKAKEVPIAVLQKLKQRQAERRELQRLQHDASSATPPAESATLAPIRGGGPRAAPVISAPVASKSRNNKQLIVNALKHVCLTGAVNAAQLEAARSIVESDECGTHFVVLLKDEYNTQFRGLYEYRGGDVMQRVFGAGPVQLRLTPTSKLPTAEELQLIPSKLFKFDSGAKKFMLLPTATFNQMADALTLPPRLRNARPPL